MKTQEKVYKCYACHRGFKGWGTFIAHTVTKHPNVTFKGRDPLELLPKNYKRTPY